MSMAVPGRWADLQLRLLSAVFLCVVGGVALWQGGAVLHMLVALLAGAMLWELARMLVPGRVVVPLVLGLAGVAAELFLMQNPGVTDLVVAGVALAAGLGLLHASGREQAWRVGLPYALAILLAGHAFVLVRDNLGFGWVVWLVAVVIATDVAGYFAGRLIGGPKFWPAVSPKKTWSGTVAGWLAAAGVGAVFALGSGQVELIVCLSVLLAMAAQAGDICESAIKRRCGVKDSSSLIPGHGGLLDRFDGLLAAALLLIVVSVVTGVPGGLI